METTTVESVEQRAEDELLMLEQLASQLGIQAASLNSAERTVILKLMELENLRTEKQLVDDMLSVQLSQLEQLLKTVDSSLEQDRQQADSLPPVFDIFKNLLTQGDKEDLRLEKKREKIKPGEESQISKNTTSKIEIFAGFEESLMKILKLRGEILNVITRKVGAGINIFTQTAGILQQTVRFGSLALDSLGLDNRAQFPFQELLKNLEKGPGSLLLVVTQFYQVIESLLSLKSEFFTTFTKNPGQIDVPKILLEVKSISINRIIPAKLRVAMRIHKESEELGRLVGEIFKCLGELVEEKTVVVENLSLFLEEKVKILQELSKGMRLEQILQALRTGELYKLISLEDPINIKGADLLRGEGSFVQESISETKLRVPILGIDLKSLLVDQNQLGQTTGAVRDYQINALLAKKVEGLIQGSNSRIYVKEGEVLINSYLPPIHLGTRCLNDILIEKSAVTARVRRSSILKTTAGVTLYNRGKPTTDVLNFGHLYLDISLTGGLHFSLGQTLFGTCIKKLETELPLSVEGVGVADITAAVIITDAKLELRRVSPNIVPGFRNPLTTNQIGSVRPHLVMQYTLQLHGTIVNINIKKLKLSGCEIKLLGLNLFSYCDFIEKLVRRELENRIKKDVPLSTDEILNQIKQRIRKRFGDEIAIPLILSSRVNLRSIQRLVDKTRMLVDLNVQLFQRLASFTEELNILEDAGGNNKTRT